MRIAHLAWRVALSLAATVGAVFLALTYTIGGGYFPGGPMHFPGDDIPPALAVSLATLVVCALLGALYWIWDDVISWRLPAAVRSSASEALAVAGTLAIAVVVPVAALSAVVVYLATI